MSEAYRVETAPNGEVGLQKAKELVPDLIITDLMMPVMDGVTLCKELRSSIETSHVPVIMLTAKTAHESQMDGLRSGADDYVMKPFHMDLLQVRVENLLESRRLLREKFLKEVPVMTPKLGENSTEREFLDKAMAVLEENYSSWEFKADDFAAGMNMSRRTLLRKLKAVSDRTPSGFITEFRMMKAAEKLINSSETVVEIAFAVGCDESTNFARLFKKHYDVTPTQYREEHQSS